MSRTASIVIQFPDTETVLIGNPKADSFSCRKLSGSEMLAQPLDRMFFALADPQRRGMVERLSTGPATVKQLAAPSGMRLPSAVKHLKVLEEGGLVASRKAGRTRTFSLNSEAMRTIGEWARSRETAWNSAFDRLAAAMLELEQEDGEQ